MNVRFGGGDTPYPLGQRSLPYTLKATLYGHEVLVTLRGVDFASVKAQVEDASEWLKDQTPGQRTEQPKDWCTRHSVQMQHNHQERPLLVVPQDGRWLVQGQVALHQPPSLRSALRLGDIFNIIYN